MDDITYRLEFFSGVDLKDVEATVLLAFVAAEGLFGQAAVRLQATYHVLFREIAIEVSGDDGVVTAIAKIATSFLTAELGDNGFQVRRTPASLPSDSTKGAAA